MKAQKFIAPRIAKADATDRTLKTLQTIKRHRKQRFAKLKEMLKEDEDDYPRRNNWARGLVGGQMVCPICSQTVRGDQGVLEAHVDSCVTNEELRLAEQAQQEALQRQYEEEARWEENDNGNYVGDLRGMFYCALFYSFPDVFPSGAGFHTRDRQTQDVDDEIDIDGEDAAFGAPQFTEGDVVHLEDREQDTDEDADVDIDIDDEETGASAIAARRHPSRRGGTSTPRTTTPHENPARLQVAAMAARKRADRAELMTTLEQTLPPTPLKSPPTPSATSPVCRICLDPYEEPTVSTGCWHTCCRECWLRCLGTTKLCPICKRITIPSDLRLIYM